MAGDKPFMAAAEQHLLPGARIPGGYCVARMAQSIGVTTPEDLVAQLGAASVLTLKGAFIDHDPVTELSRLVAILGGEPTGKGPVVATPVDADPGEPLAMARVSARAVFALQGADGDPEIEWDDVVALWCRSGGLSEHTVAEELLGFTDRLRQLASAVQAGRGADTALYCWRSNVPLSSKPPLASRRVTSSSAAIQTALGR